MTSNLDRPNIVFVTVDQLAASALGCYGSGVGSTPNLDRLASAGVRFDRCYASCPICAPNRATFLTGRSPVVHGVISNNYVLRPDVPTYAHVLRHEGYHTIGVGKFHQTPMSVSMNESMEHLGFERSVVTEDSKWGPWLEWVRERSPEYAQAALGMCWGNGAPRGVDATLQTQWTEAVARIVEPRKDAFGCRGAFASPLPPELHDSTFVTERALEYIRSHERSSNARPYFCHVSYVDPHDPYDPPEGYADLYDPSDMPRPLAAEWHEQGPACISKTYPATQFDGMKDEEGVRKLRAMYHGSLRYLDDQIGVLIDGLLATGSWENTVLIFTSDHGDLLGDHGTFLKADKHYDGSTRCPLIVAGGGVEYGLCDELVCSLDFFPTILSLAAVPPSEWPPREGVSFLTSGRSAASTRLSERDEVCIDSTGVASVVTRDRWRLTYYTNFGEGQMFDLSRDPREQHNLFDDPRSSAKREELWQRLVRSLTRSHDVPQYRNMPVYGDRKHHRGNHITPGEPGPPLYRTTDPPY
jgi:arylsulfatase